MAATIDLVRPTLRVREAASILGIANETAYDCIKRGDLKAIRFGRRVLVPTSEVERLLGRRLLAVELELAQMEVEKALKRRKMLRRIKLG